MSVAICKTHSHSPRAIGIQCGFWPQPSVVAYNTVNYFTITFPKPFKTVPNVVIVPIVPSGAYQVGNHFVAINSGGITTTGCQGKWYVNETSGRYPSGVQWIAVGKISDS